jgi:hypothetical protein
VSLYYADIQEFADEHPGMDPEAIGRAMVANLTKRQLAEFACAYVASMVTGYRRRLAREAEERAGRERQHQEAAEARGRAAVSEAERFAKWRDDPGGASHESSTVRDRRRFRKWMGDGFAEWYDRAHEAAEQADAGSCPRAGSWCPQHVIGLESDWYEDGVAAYFAARRYQAVCALVKAEAARVRLEVTAELLGTKFALGDGTHVTWGEATVDQHRQRAELLTVNAAGVVETAARHVAAIRMIEEAGVTSLGELAGEPFCRACAGQVGIFQGRGAGWHHFRGEGTAASPVELYDPGHLPDVGYRDGGTS